MRRWIVAGILTVVLLAASIATFTLLKQSSQGDDKDSTLIEVSVTNIKLLKSIKITQGSQVIVLQREGSGWTGADISQKLDNLRCEAMATYLCYVYATNQLVIEPGELGKFGLDTPVITAEITLTNGTLTTFSFGDYTADQSAVYFMKDGDSSVYTMMREHYLQIKGDLNALRDLSLPEIQNDNIARFATKTDGYAFEIEKSEYYESGYIFKDSGAAVSTQFIEKIKEFPSFRLDAFVDETVSPKYGLDQDAYIRIEDSSGRFILIRLGSEVDGGQRYCTVEGKDGVFLAGSNITGFIGPDRFFNTDLRLIPVAPDLIQSLMIIGRSSAVVLKEADGRYYLDAREISLVGFKDALTAICSVQAKGSIEKSAGEVLAYTIEIRLKTGVVFSVQLIDYLKGFYAIDYGRGQCLYIETTQIEDALEAVRSVKER